MDIHKIPPKLIMAYILVLACLVLFLVYLFSPKESKKNETLNTITIEQQQSTYASKLAAYKAKRKKEREKNTTYKPLPLTTSADSASSVKATPVPSPPKTRKEEKKISRKEDKKKIEEVDTTRDLQAEIERRRQALSSWNTIGQNNVNTPSSTYKAVIHGNQLVASGETATFRATEDFHLGDAQIPKNTLITGVVSIQSNRVDVTITSIRVGKKIYSTRLNAFGTDGLKGIPVNHPDKIQHSATRDISNEAVNTVKQRGGIAGEILGNLVKTVQQEQERRIQLIDNQTVYFKIQ